MLRYARHAVVAALALAPLAVGDLAIPDPASQVAASPHTEEDDKWDVIQADGPVSQRVAVSC